MAKDLKIGEVAALAGVRVDTVRFYERLGLLPVAARAPSGYRFFAPAAVERIQFVKRAQALGFTLDETAEILRSLDAGTVDYAQGSARLRKMLARIDEKVAELRGVRRELAKMLATFEAGSCEELERTARRIRSAPSSSSGKHASQRSRRA
jgi:DNA-binding transcriptional MerR regulator